MSNPGALVVELTGCDPEDLADACDAEDLRAAQLLLEEALCRQSRPTVLRMVRSAGV